ncbi:hypothetical protein ASPSYDRAFT_31810 [Aspergillus sydowii CBS 593.65]|uniref:Uncharacterized protein n=1 Tax=Aspergillus sydowii CBS 593.65 TaxID=1036612 RepID=A0A1L9TIE1_9EURO|nr:uncharacterized protein ASPSYDRAFT_31810 [Aspergillus sydowii CBS 593.65]OJJ59198.1 hypothetical protein ASPSYDRAFT_31810 [Aspergillus sydowii CBS 593.65]
MGHGVEIHGLRQLNPLKPSLGRKRQNPTDPAPELVPSSAISKGTVDSARKKFTNSSKIAFPSKSCPQSIPSRLASQHALAGAYQNNGQIKQGVELLEQVVAVWERTIAEEHPDQLAPQHALAVWNGLCVYEPPYGLQGTDTWMTEREANDTWH